jgi:hypothetical protein
MDGTVRNLNDITSYSKFNLERQVKNLELRHTPYHGPEETCAFPVSMLPRAANSEFYGREDELRKIDQALSFKEHTGLLRSYSKFDERGKRCFRFPVPAQADH